MYIEMPVLRQGSESERIDRLERWAYSLAERMNALPFEIEGFSRSGRGELYDEITLTYPDGSRVRYDLVRSDR